MCASQRDGVVPGRGTSISTSARPLRSVVAAATSIPSIANVNATPACRFRTENSMSCFVAAAFANSTSPSPAASASTPVGSSRGSLLAVELYNHVHGCCDCGEKTNE